MRFLNFLYLQRTLQLAEIFDQVCLLLRTHALCMHDRRVLYLLGGILVSGVVVCVVGCSYTSMLESYSHVDYRTVDIYINWPLVRECARGEIFVDWVRPYLVHEAVRKVFLDILVLY